MVAFSKVSTLFVGVASAGRIASEEEDAHRFKAVHAVESSSEFLTISQKSAEAITQSADDTINDAEFQQLNGREAAETSLVQAPRGKPEPPKTKDEGDGWFNIDSDFEADSPAGSYISESDGSHIGSWRDDNSDGMVLTDHTVDTDFSSASDRESGGDRTPPTSRTAMEERRILQNRRVEDKFDE